MMTLGELLLVGLLALWLYKPFMWMSERLILRAMKAWDNLGSTIPVEEKPKKK